MPRTPWILAITLMAGSSTACAATTTYTSPVAFLAALQAAGLEVVHEGFEDDGTWGSVRTTLPGSVAAAPAIDSLGVTWASNFAVGEITTSNGAARSGSWGVYASPHGSYGIGVDCQRPGRCGDGFTAVAATGFLAFGGFIRSNTPPAKIALLLDGTPIDLGDADALGTSYAFFGAISSAPFARVEYREMEGTSEDAKLIFGDDFRFALAPVPEPPLPALWLGGLALLAWRAQRRKATANPR